MPSNSNPALHRQNSPLTLSRSQKRKGGLLLKKWAPTRPKAEEKLGGGEGRGGGAGDRGLGLRHAVGTSLPAPLPPPRPLGPLPPAGALQGTR